MRRRFGLREDAAMAVIVLFVELFGSSPLPYYVVALGTLAVFVALTLVRESARTETLRFDCAYLAAAYLMVETEDDPALQADFRVRALVASVVSGGLALVGPPRLFE